MKLPFDGAISAYLNDDAPNSVRDVLLDPNASSVLDKSYPYRAKMSKKAYRKAIAALHVELVKFQSWVQSSGVRVALVFEGREDLIAEAALQGYEIFADVMQRAFDDGKPSALAAFEATGRAYLAFARRYPGHYIAMFESGISVNRTSQLAAASAHARGILEQAAYNLSLYLPADKRPPSSMFSAHILALSHGVVELYARNSPGTASQYPPEDLLETGIGIYLRGLGLLDADT